MTNRTKIITTLGPATDSEKGIAALVAAGADVLRLNFSFREHAYHRQVIERIRRVEKKFKKTLTILADLQGPKIRLGALPKEGMFLKKGSVVRIISGPAARGGKIPVNYGKLLKEVKVGDRLLLDDGKIELRLSGKTKQDLAARVIFGGKVTTGKGVAFPDSTLLLTSITVKDLSDAKFAVAHGADYVVASFIKTKDDILFLKKRLKRGTRIMVKVEKKEALANLNEILSVSDAAMIGRGDLALEIKLGELTLAQKEIIRACRDQGKPVIVATQMLESMIQNPRPTRAEVTDIANAVIDHTDAVMLSAESATGSFPVAAVKIMAEIIADTEKSAYDDLPLFSEEGNHHPGPEEHWAKLATLFSRQDKITGLIVQTEQLSFLGALVRHRPEITIVMPTSHPGLARAANLFWGVEPVLLKKVEMKNVLRHGLAKKWWKKKDLVLHLDAAGRFSILPVI